MAVRQIVMLIAAGPLIACVAGATPPAGAAGSCGAEAFQGLVGQPESRLADLTLPAGTRVIHPTDRITMDKRADRLNVDIDAQGRIARVHCG